MKYAKFVLIISMQTVAYKKTCLNQFHCIYIVELLIICVINVMYIIFILLLID